MAGQRIVLTQPHDPLLHNVYDDVAFRYWFDIVTADRDGDILAEYHLEVTSQGRKKLSRFDLPERFPAIVRARRQPLALYFAGDFSDNELQRGPHWLAGWPAYKRFARLGEHYADQSSFFWELFVPLWGSILDSTRSAR